MKTQASRRRRGFTLIELLVVIAIIAVLAAAGFGAALIGINKAKKTKGIATASAIEQAVNAFYDTYGRLPDPSNSASQDETIDTKQQQGVDLITILMGKETDSPLQNDKKIKFLEVNEGKGGKGGLIYNTNGTIDGLFDPWGNGFKVVLDFDYDEEIEAPAESMPQNATDRIKRGRRVLVYSLGIDEQGGSETIKNW
jgi:prepilin-type N-terminal cleavage/methylation domain-containing protein